MDMKGYILVGGGLLICLVLLHALVSAWRVSRRQKAVGSATELDALDMATEDASAVPPADDPATELTGEPFVDEPAAALTGEPLVDEPAAVLTGEPLVDEPAAALTGEPLVDEPAATLTGEPLVDDLAEDDPVPPVLMERPEVEGDESVQGDAKPLEASVPRATYQDTMWPAETTPAPEATDTGSGAAPQRGRRIEIAGKRTEPTVPRAMRSEYHHFPQNPPPPETRSSNGPVASLDDVIVFWLFAKPGQNLDGETLLKSFVSHGLTCDADLVFKKADPRCGGHWYTVANGVEPGKFDISRPAALETPGVVMLLNLGEVRDPSAAFEDMLDVAQNLAIALDAELKDERRSDMSAQTIEHCRQRIRDHRRMLLRA